MVGESLIAQATNEQLYIKNRNSLDRKRRGSGGRSEEECLGEDIPSRKNGGRRQHRSLKEIGDTWYAILIFVSGNEAESQHQVKTDTYC